MQQGHLKQQKNKKRVVVVVWVEERTDGDYKKMSKNKFQNS